MSKQLSRWMTGTLVFLILFSSFSFVAAEEPATTPDADLSQYKTLTVGYVGPEVAALKQRMYELGYYKKNTVNESFTASTAEYVRKFEKMNGLHVDGIADPEMQALFFSDQARKADGSVAPAKRVIQLQEELIGNAEEDEINQRFRDFLDGVGDFSEEKIEAKRHYLKSSGMPLRDLGFYEGMEDRAEAQGILLSHFRFDDSELLAIGIKDRKGQRRVTLVEWPVIWRLKIPNIKCGFSMISGNSYSSMFLESEEDIVNFLEWKTGSIVLCTYLFSYDMSKISEDETARLLYYEIMFSRNNTNLDYVSSLLFPKKSTLRNREVKYYDRKAKTKLPEIRSVQDIQDYLKGAPALPFTAGLSVSGSKYALPDWLEKINQQNP